MNSQIWFATSWVRPDELQAHWDRVDSRNCRKGKHDANRPVWAGPHGWNAGWRCMCGAICEPPKSDTRD